MYASTVSILYVLIVKKTPMMDQHSALAVEMIQLVHRCLFLLTPVSLNAQPQNTQKLEYVLPVLLTVPHAFQALIAQNAEEVYS